MLGLVAVVANEWLMPDEVSNSSSGMAAFGDLVLFVGVAGLAGLIPTWWLVGLALRR